MSSCYDLIIVGAGPAGLRIGIETLKKHPTLRCCILEKYNYVGGRVVTYRKNIPSVGDVQWENGAGRISTSHKRVMKLIHQYKLHTIPISGKTSFLRVGQSDLEKDMFYAFHKMYLEPLRHLSKEILGTHTLVQLLNKTIGPKQTAEFVIQFPYYSEMHVLRADLALDAFDAEMSSNDGFVCCKEGYQSITEHMLQEFLERGGILVKQMEVMEIKKLGHLMQVIGKETSCGQKIKRIMNANRVVLALHYTALRALKGFKSPILRHLEMPPLLRIYAIFPKEKGHVWFENLPNIVTNSNLRYIIPIDVNKGIIMISYTEGPDAQYWMNMSSQELEQNIYSQVRSLFSWLSIPPPLFIKSHPWTDGCTYWKPGYYDPLIESTKSLHPDPHEMPNLFVCSESFSIHQSWVESALESAEQLMLANRGL